MLSNKHDKSLICCQCYNIHNTTIQLQTLKIHGKRKKLASRIKHHDFKIHRTLRSSGWHSCFVFESSPVQFTARISAIGNKDFRGLSQFQQKHSGIQTSPDLRSSCVPVGLAPVTLSGNRKWVYMWSSIFTKQSLQMKSRLHHNETWTAAAWTRRSQCYRPAIFFRHLRLITLSFPSEKQIGKRFKIYNFFSISLRYFFNCVSPKMCYVMLR